jgi:aspartyl protease family protein
MPESQPRVETSSRWGRRMLIAGWVLALLLLTGMFQRLLDVRENPNRRPTAGTDAQGVREVVLRRNVAGHYLAGGEINGVAVTFLLDTGATDVALPAALARRIDLPVEGRGISRTAAGDVEVLRTTLERVRLGNVELREVRASILPRMEGEAVLLGMSFLKKLEMVQREGVLTLRQY